LRFGDVITATASATVIFVLIEAVLAMVLVPMYSYLGLEIAGIVSFLLSGIIVGYAFAGKIREESRIMALGRIIVLSAVVMLFASMMTFAVIGHYNTVIDEGLQDMFSTGSWASTDWYAYEAMALIGSVALNVAYGLIFGFIGLYVGSMRKPSTKTKE